MIRKLGIAIITATWTSCLSLGAWSVEIGVAACDITPDVKRYEVPMAGYGARNGKPSTGVKDPIFAKVLYLQDGDKRMALVTVDLRSVTQDFKNQIIRKAQGSGLTRENLLVCASHNHSGPSLYAEKFWQLQFGVYDPAIIEEMTDRIAAAIAEARSNLFTGRIGTAQIMVEGFTRNRRWGYDTEAREAAGETPALHPRLWVLRVDDNEGLCRAVLVNFATHPTILGADNFDITSEWPGVLQRRLEFAFPEAVALYSNGAEGDQAPAGAKGETAFERADDFGTRLATQAAKLVSGIKTESDFSIDYTHWDAPLGEPIFSEAAKRGQYSFMHPMALEALPRHAELQQLRLGDTVLAGLPGEPIMEVGVATEEALRGAGADGVITIGLANDYIGYILNEKEYAHGGYEVDSRSYYGPSLGKRVADASAKVFSGKTP